MPSRLSRLERSSTDEVKAKIIDVAPEGILTSGTGDVATTGESSFQSNMTSKWVRNAAIARVCCLFFREGKLDNMPCFFLWFHCEMFVRGRSTYVKVCASK